MGETAPMAVERLKPYGKKSRTGAEKLLVLFLFFAAWFWAFAAGASADIVNTATVTASFGATPVTAVSNTVSVPVAPNDYQISFDKNGTLNNAVAGSPTATDVGDTISYTFDVSNTGSGAVTAVSILDSLVTPSGEFLFVDGGTPPASTDGGPDGTWDSLGTDDTVRFTATYVITATDITNGSVVNAATASVDAGGSPLTANDSVTTPLTLTSSLTLDKVAALVDGGDGIANAGDTIDYTFTVTNTGTSTLTNVSVSDPLVNFAGLPGRAEALTMMAAAAAGADPIVTASTELALDDSHMLTLAPVATGQIALAYPGRVAPELATALHINRKLVRLQAGDEELKSGDEIAIYFDLTNTGDGPLTSITVEQQGAVAFGDALDILPANVTDSASVIFTRKLSDEDIAAGSFSLPAIIRAKSRDRSRTFAALDDLSLADIVTLEELATATITPANVPSLAPGGIAVFTATYVLLQFDVDAGQVVNTAEATGNGPNGETPNAIDSATTLLPPVPSITVIKTGVANLGGDGVASVGDVITYSFDVKNTGNVTLSAVAVTDPDATMSGGPLASLAPGVTDTATFTATHILVQADVDAGQFTNQATGGGTPPSGPPVTDLSDDDDETQDDPTIVSLAPNPDISLIKTGVIDLGVDGLATIGDTINYTFTVRNTGNVTLQSVTVVDALVTMLGGPLADLDPGESDATTFTATYVLTQADIDAGLYQNQATASGTPPVGAAVTDLSDDGDETEDDPTITPIIRTPGVALLKSVTSITDTNSNTVTDEGDVITYGFTVVNTGNVTLSNLTLTDANAILTGGPILQLLPGQSDIVTFIATHTVVTADMAAGRVTNQATVTADEPTGGQVTDLSDASDLTEDDPTVTPTQALPAIAVIKQATGIVNTNGNGLVDAGDTVQYTFTVRNTGNVDLTNVTITDPLPGIVLAGGPVALMDAGDTDTTTFTATYVLTVADISAGQVSNQATVSGVAPDSSVVQDLSDESDYADDDPTVVTVANAPEVRLIKTVSGITDTNSNSIDDLGDVITYAFMVSNTGNVPLTQITVTDANAVVSGGPLASLAVTASNSTTFTGSHVITQADIDAGGFSNQAIVTARAPDNPPGTPVTVTDLSDDNSPTEDQPTYRSLGQLPAIAVVKTIGSVTDVNGNGRNDVGDVINYRFAVHNTGNVTLTNITLTDPNAVIAGGPIASLAPNMADTTTFTATHVVTVSDADAEVVVNQATVSGESPTSVVVSDLSDNGDVLGNDPTTVVISAPLPTLTKTVAQSEVKRGERISYTITASNLRDGPYDVTDIMPPAFDFVNGSATVNGTAVTPVEAGNVLTFANITPVGGKIIVKLNLLSSATVSTGRMINKARLLLNATGEVLATAQVAVTIKEEHVFDCGEIIGRVFDDLNANGYADDGEPGLPGVRVITVRGELITTDKKGRFHVPCADVPNAAIGSNYLMKLDPRTLPLGYRLTTENPRDVRLTRGKVTKLNFGATRDRSVQLDLKRDAFLVNSLELLPTWATGLERLIDLLEQGRGQLTIVYRCGEYAPIADARVEAVAGVVRQKWADRGHDRDLVVKARVECGK